jgi:large subunit ribosomal protein L24
MKIKKDDHVVVIAGKDKGKRGKVLRALIKENKVVVEGVNLTKKHKRAGRKGMKGEVIEMAMPLHVSNVMVEDPKDKKPTRVGYKMIKGKKVRVAKRSDSEI